MIPLLPEESLFQNLMIVFAGGVKCCVATLNVSLYFIMAHIIFSGPLGLMSSCLIVLDKRIIFK